MEKIFDQNNNILCSLTGMNLGVSSFMRFCIDELKSQADRMARLEKQIAELIQVDEENIKVGGTN